MSATSVKVSVQDTEGAAVIWGGEKRQLTRDTLRWWNYFFDPPRYDEDWTVTGIPPISGILEVELYGGRPAIGSIIVGEHVQLGYTKYGPRFGFKDYSVNTTDDYGNPLWVKRRNAKRGSFISYIPPKELDYVQQRLSDITGSPALWIGDDGCGYQSMTIFGFLKSCDTSLVAVCNGEATFEIEGIV